MPSPADTDAARTATLPESARTLIESAVLGHLVTLNADGSPHLTCVWVGLDGDDVVFASMFNFRKTQNLARDPRVALSIESDERHQSGLQEYLILRGLAEVTEGGAFDLIRRLAATYIGPGAQIPPPQLADHAGFVTRVRVTEISGVGPWAGDPPSLPSTK